MPDSPQSKPSAVWPVFLTIVGILLIAALASVPFVAGDPSPEGLPDLTKFLGRFHPVFLHLPIGMLLLVMALEIGHFFPRRRAGYSTRMAMFFAAASAVIATLLGLLLYYGTGNYRDEIAERHLYGGLAFAGLMVATFIVKVWVDHASGKGTWLYWLLLLGSSGVMGFASHDGGTLTHGEGYLTAFAPEPVRKALRLPAREVVQSGVAAATVREIPADPVVYADILVPVFEQKCYGCHSEAKRVRGKYRMEQYELLVKGGSTGEAIVPGDSKESNLFHLIDLPLEDPDHMPPEDKEQLEEHEVTLIRWWIDQGASPDKKLSELEPTAEITEAVALWAASAATSATDSGAEDSKEDDEEKEEAAPDPIRAEVEQLQVEFPIGLTFESQASSEVVFTTVSLGKAFGDDALAKLAPVLPAAISLDFSGSGVTDAGVKHLEAASGVRTLKLSGTSITDASLETVAKLTSLESLNLYGTQVSNEGIGQLASLTNLKKLYVWQTQVDAAGVAALKEKLPECDIVLGGL